MRVYAANEKEHGYAQQNEAAPLQTQPKNGALRRPLDTALSSLSLGAAQLAVAPFQREADELAAQSLPALSSEEDGALQGHFVTQRAEGPAEAGQKSADVIQAAAITNSKNIKFDAEGKLVCNSRTDPYDWASELNVLLDKRIIFTENGRYINGHLVANAFKGENKSENNTCPWGEKYEKKHTYYELTVLCGDQSIPPTYADRFTSDASFSLPKPSPDEEGTVTVTAETNGERLKNVLWQHIESYVDVNMKPNLEAAYIDGDRKKSLLQNDITEIKQTMLNIVQSKPSIEQIPDSVTFSYGSTTHQERNNSISNAHVGEFISGEIGEEFKTFFAVDRRIAEIHAREVKKEVAKERNKEEEIKMRTAPAEGIYSGDIISAADLFG